MGAGESEGGLVRRFLVSFTGIRSRLFLLTALTLLPIVLLLVYFFATGYTLRREQALQTEVEVARGIETTLNAYLDALHQQLTTLGQALLTFAPITEIQARQLLQISSEFHPAIVSLSWLGADGELIASSESKNTQSLDRELLPRAAGANSLVVGDLVPSPLTGDGVVPAIAAIEDGSGRVVGLVVAMLNPIRLGQTILSAPRVGDGGYTIFDSAGTVLYYSRDPAISMERRKAWLKDDAVLRAAMRTGDEQLGCVRLPPQDVEYVAARAPMEKSGWFAGASRPLLGVIAPVRMIVMQEIILAAIAFALAFLLAHIAARTIARPLQRLDHDVKAVSEGIVRREEPIAPAEVQRLRRTVEDMTTELVRRAGELARSNADLELFAHTISHDLQEPLRGVSGFAELLLRRYGDRLDAEGKEYVLFVTAGVERMQALVKGLLQYSRIGRERATECGDADKAMRQVVEAARMQIDEMHAEVTWFELPQVAMSHVQLVQVLQNLVLNALKFRSEEPPKIDVRAERHGGEWEFSVSDNGIGIPPEHHEVIFQLFRRLHTDDDYPGTGLGLAVCRKIVERSGGRIWVESQPGKGSTFRFTIPALEEAPSRGSNRYV